MNTFFHGIVFGKLLILCRTPKRLWEDGWGSWYIQGSRSQEWLHICLFGFELHYV